MRYINGRRVKTEPELTSPKKKVYRNKKPNKFYRNIAGTIVMLLSGISFFVLTSMGVTVWLILFSLACIVALVTIIFDNVLKYDIGFSEGEKPPEDDPTREAREAVLYSMMKDRDS